jgi:hypothetical protein
MKCVDLVGSRRFARQLEQPTHVLVVFDKFVFILTPDFAGDTKLEDKTKQNKNQDMRQTQTQTRAQRTKHGRQTNTKNNQPKNVVGQTGFAGTSQSDERLHDAHKHDQADKSQDKTARPPYGNLETKKGHDKTLTGEGQKTRRDKTRVRIETQRKKTNKQSHREQDNTLTHSRPLHPVGATCMFPYIVFLIFSLQSSPPLSVRCWTISSRTFFRYTSFV